MEKKFLLREISGEFLLIPLGDNSTQFNSMITMNETGAFIWKRLENKMTADEIAFDLTKEYKVTFEKAKHDTEKFIAYLKEKSILM